MASRYVALLACNDQRLASPCPPGEVLHQHRPREGGETVWIYLDESGIKIRRTCAPEEYVPYAQLALLLPTLNRKLRQ